VVVGSPVSQIASMLPQYEAAGVPIILDQTIGSITPPVIADIAGGDYSQETGKEMADWFIADSGGKGKVLVAGPNVLPVTQVASSAFAQEVKARCSGCAVSSVQISLGDAIGGTADPTVVAALRRSPGTSYLLLAEGAFFTGIGSALSTAGLQSTKTMSLFSWLNNQNDVKDGQETVTTGNSLEELGWIDVDAALRHVEGMPVPANDSGLPSVLLTKGSSFTPSPTFSVPADYASQFKVLWHVG
jgi:ribose transport system substrate-binding protein